MLANTLFYRLSGRRLPGFVGDTLRQTPGGMNAHFRASGLRSDARLVVGKYLGFPIFLCHRAVKPGAAAPASADADRSGPA